MISLNGWGVITVYSAVILAPAEKNAADADIGLRPGSRLKLVRTTQLTKLGMRTLRPLGPARPAPEKGTPPSLDQQVPTYSLVVMPGSDMQLLAGSDAGKVLRGSLVGVPPAPKEYIPDDHKSDIANRPSAPPVPSMVTCLAASPFVPYAFASGHSNGTVAVHSLYGAAAAAVFPDVSRGKVRGVGCCAAVREGGVGPGLAACAWADARRSGGGPAHRLSCESVLANARLSPRPHLSRS